MPEVTATERHQESLVFKTILILMVVGLAVAFTWLFYVQHERTSDNRRLTIQTQTLLIRLAKDEAALKANVVSGCYSGNDLRHTLKHLLVIIEHFPSPVPVTPPVLAAEKKLYAELIATIKFRSCTVEPKPKGAKKK